MADSIKFVGDDAQFLEAAYGHAKRVIEMQAGQGDAGASDVLKVLNRMEASSTIFTVQNDPTLPRGGETWPGSTDIRINLPDIRRSGDYGPIHPSVLRTVPTVLLHELGHAGSAFTVFGTARIKETALEFENAYRRFFNWTQRDWHN